MSQFSRRGYGMRMVAVAAALPLVAGLAACSGPGGSGADAAGPGEKVTLEFWGWAPGYDKSVELWNKAHPDVQVKFTKTESGAAGGYEKMIKSTKSGNAPCLAQVGFESIPSFLVEGALEDVSEHAADDKAKFVDWTWNQVSFGDKVFAAPVDTAPLAMFYREDVFQKAGVKVPTTWADYAKAGEKLKKKGSYLTSFNEDMYHFSGLAWQNGARWFGTDGDTWKIDINGAATTEVAEYWQDLAAKDLLKVQPAFDTGWYADATSGKMATIIAPVWGTALIEQNAAAAKGKWHVAPLPQWEEGTFVGANSGGSSTAILKGCEHPEQAWEFASWMSTDAASVSNLIKETGIYPAGKDALTLPELSEPSEYFGGDKIYDVFADAAAKTNTEWQWGPTVTQVGKDFADAFGAALEGKGSLADGLSTVQDKTVEQLKAKGLSVG